MTCTPQGEINSTSTMNGLMSIVFRDFPPHHLVTFLDDIITASETYRSHLQLLDRTLTAIEGANLKLNPAKSSFCLDEIVCLGFVLSVKGVGPDPRNLEKIISWPVPRNVKETRGFLGLVSFYRHFIKNFSSIAAPLTDLTKKESKFEWSPPCQSAFKCLVASVTSDSVIAVPDFDRQFILKTDACLISIGCVLQQEYDTKNKVICFDSKKKSYRTDRRIG